MCDVLFKCGFAKMVCAGHYIVLSVFSLGDCTLENANLDLGKLDLGLVSAGSNGVQP